MRQQSKNSLSVLGVVIAASSLWMTWLNFDQVPVHSQMLEMQQALMGGSDPITYSGQMSGFYGSLLYLPIWVVVLIISFAHATQLMAATSFFDVPKFVRWMFLVAALFFPTFAIVYPVFNDGVTPGLGPFIALLSSAIASVTLMLPEGENQSQQEKAKVDVE